MKRILVFALSLGLGTAPAWSQESQGTASQKAEIASIRGKDADRLNESRQIMKTLLSGRSGIADALVNRAKCIVIIPSVKKLAIGLGVDYGRGVMSCRLGENYDGPWSAPAMYALEGGNFGFQLGVQATDLVLLVLNERGVDSLLRSKAKLGGDISVAAGPIGRSMTAATDLGMRAQMLSYSHTGGVFAGVSLAGSTLRPDNRGNDVLYGRELTAREIVRSGQVAVPPAGRPLIRMLDQSKAVAEAPENNPENNSQSPR